MANFSLTEGVHYYFNVEGKMVLTSIYLQERGYCCGNGCFHCPYEYINVPEERREALLQRCAITQEKEDQ